jgi:predicted nucleic acid-binding protein
MKNKKKTPKLDALIFIDTNIYLDFYRIRKSDVSIKYLNEIETHKDIIITISQVEMEYKKHRQNAIFEALGAVKKISDPNTDLPAVVSDAKAVEMIKKSRKVIDEQQKKLKRRIESILTNPNRHDPVFKVLQSLFSNHSEINLNRQNKERYTIRKLALKRFILGYPPRKNSDNSIGDAVNWEWIIRCAEITKKHIIIVSRDYDFGLAYENELFVNDWLSQEFKQRISQQRKLILTNKLTQAFKLVEIPVTQEMIDEEVEISKLTSSTIYNNVINESLFNFGV